MEDYSLRWWKRGVAFGLALLAGMPLLAPFLDLGFQPPAWTVFAEGPRMVELAGTTLLLLGGTTAVALPLGSLLGLLLFRCQLPGAWLGRLLFSAALFLPLPLVASGWQMAGQFLHLSGLLDSGWAVRLLVGIGLHALVCLPWVMLITGLGFQWVEPELEEEAQLAAPWCTVFWRVTLPRSRASLGLAALVTMLFCWSEITLTDQLRLRTYSEEVYTQLVASNDTEVARAVAASLPALLLILPLTIFTLQCWQRSCPSRLHILRETRLLPLRKWQLPAGGMVFLLAFLVLGVPLFGLIWKAGLRYATVTQPGPPTWELGLLLERFGMQCRVHSELILRSLILCLGVGFLAARGGLLLTWFMRHDPRWEKGLWCLAAMLLTLPGPLLGLGLLTFLQWLFLLPGGEWLKPLFWSLPSALPNLWICLLRFGPIAMALLWPLLRQVPRELEEAAALDGTRPWERWQFVILPSLGRPATWAMLVVATLTMGEISASKLVTTPGYTPLAHHVFQQMHAGADTELAALCLVLLAGVLLGGLLVVAWPWRTHRPVLE